MLSREAFIDFILKGPPTTSVVKKLSEHAALPEGFEGFAPAVAEAAVSTDTATFAQRLLEAAGFGYPELVGRDSLIRSGDAVARYLPERVSFWPKTTSRPYQTLLFEAALTHRQLLDAPAFKGRQISHLDIVEDALARLVSAALDGFQRGGESVTADVRRGRKEETLCVVSIVDEREGEPARLLCFGTQNASTDGLETFQITERTRSWDVQLAREHLEKLLAVCTRKAPKVADIQEVVLDLLDTIAKGFGLKKKPNTERRLQAFELPPDHDIGIDPEERAGQFGGHNPFGGVTLRDERSRLLGYIIYPLKGKGDAARLREHLEANNRFHNVLVVYPDQDQASLELWQGRDQLRGKLRQGQEYKDAADVVNLLSRFFVVSKAKVRNPGELAQELAYRARYLRGLAVIELEEEKSKGPLRNLYNAFKEALVHDQTEDEFADAFAQTITYGLLTARWLGSGELSTASERLTRQTALKHLAAGNPFLNELFKSVLSVRLDDQRGRLLWLVDDIADLLDRIDVQYVFGAGDVGADSATDPVIHFYEPFLAAYDKKLKNKRGVFFTPRPVVSYIVRSVHEILRTEFGIEAGLASTETWGEVANRLSGLEIPDGTKSTDPFVQVLDPAVGTGTFLYECIEVVERVMKTGWCLELGKNDWQNPEVIARWNDYVRDHLLPRIFGYELMMASYAVAHLKLTFKLAQTGYRHEDQPRLNVFLTNSLEPPHDIGQQKLAGAFPALAREALAVDSVKRHRGFTVVIGNPPYSGHSSNIGAWITDLVDNYYLVDGKPLGERNPKWLQDDYVKFMRLGEFLVAKSGCGILGFITNHGYLDNPTFRGLRRHLMSSFDAIDVVDLHGNSTKKERCPDGSEDQNVFDIKQGVAIFVGRRAVPHLSDRSRVGHYQLFGLRQHKYGTITETTITTHVRKDVQPSGPFYLFVPQDINLRGEYSQYLSITQAMPVNVLGFQTHRDHFAIDLDRAALLSRITDFREAQLNDEKVSALYELTDNRDWNVRDARRQLRADTAWKDSLMDCLYRPFDWRSCYFSTVAMDYPRREMLDHVASKDNLCLGLGRQGIAVQDPVWSLVTVSRQPIDANVFRRGGVNVFPAWLYPPEGSLGQEQRPNCSGELEAMVSALLKDKRSKKDEDIDAEIVIRYAYAIFHSPTYRSRYADFLKIDFPRLPLTRNSHLFAELAVMGQELVALHLLESCKSDLSNDIRYVGPPEPQIERIGWSGGAVWLDAGASRKDQPMTPGTVGFHGVPEAVWNYYIGGYQVCEKWLKDRKGRRLRKHEIDRYQKIVMALRQTIRIMKKIDEVISKHGGWPDAFVRATEGNK